MPWTQNRWCRCRTWTRAFAPAAIVWAAWCSRGYGDDADATPSAAPCASVESQAVVGVPGGLSDLALPRGGAGRLWATTDRGPNGTVNIGGKKVRTLLQPGFAPEIMEMELPGETADRAARVVRTIPLSGRSGSPLSGRPNGVGRDEPILDADGGTPLPGDPNGVDTEGLVQMADGSFWMVEEYRPSLLRVSAEGRVLARYVPEGTKLDGADAEVLDVLPAAYALRRDNRGFESIAVSPDGTRLWTMLQSPLDNGKSKTVNKAGNVRLLAFDPVACRPVAEHVYRLGDPADVDYLAKGAAPSDGKLCALATIDDDSLLVIEQDDKSVVRLYRIDLAGATNTLARKPSRKELTLEEIRNLEASGIVPVEKTLVTDLAPLVATMRRDVCGDAGASEEAPLKLEGMAILGPDRVAIVNDNDFGVNVKPGATCRSCLWVIRLPASLSAEISDLPRAD
ncbi:MAG: esterase-like activity of phytase family protein [Planctomycetota bacterium]